MNLAMLVFCVPILAVILHLLSMRASVKTKLSLQLVMVSLWLVASVALLLSNDNTLVIKFGAWPPPFGIAFVLDKLTCIMLCVLAVIAFSISLYSAQDDDLQHTQSIFYVGFWLLLLGATGTLATADLFNLYVWFELMLVSAFTLLATTSTRNYRAIAQYAVINILGTLLLLLGIALLYAKLGTLNYADIARALMHPQTVQVLPILGLIFFAMAVKAGLFPLYFWLPAAYPVPSYSAIMALSSIITKVVMVVVLRLVWLWAPLHDSSLMLILMLVAWATMFFGVMGAANQFFFKRILAFHIVSQLGYILLAITLPSKAGIVAGVYFIIHNIFVKTNLFMVSGAVSKYYGTDDLHALGKLAQQHKWLAAMFFIAAMSLAGFPPLSGFWAKFLLIKAALSAHFYVSTGVAIFVSLFTLYSMVKIWRYVFSEAAQGQAAKQSTTSLSMFFVLASLPLLVLPILMGLFPDIILQQLHVVAEQLMDKQQYIQGLLG